MMLLHVSIELCHTSCACVYDRTRCQPNSQYFLATYYGMPNMKLKQQIEKKDEELQNCKKNIKQTRFFEAEQEIKVYKDELIRLRYILE